MRWQALFDDLEAQLAAADPAGAMDAERTRAEVAAVALGDRLRAARGTRVSLLLRDGSPVDGEVLGAGDGWLLLAPATGGEVLLPVAAVSAVRGLPRALAAPASRVEARLGLASVLRRLARDRSAVVVDVVGGRLTGTVDRVGADHLDLAEHPLDEARRPAAVRSVVVVPLVALLAVRRSGS